MNVDGVVLAAGLSSRAGTHKMVLDIGGRAILDLCIAAMYDVCSSVIVVGGYGFENIRPVCDRLPKVRLVFNRGFRSGMFSSIKEGLRHVAADRFFLTPGDCPFIKSATYRGMLELDGEIVVPEFDGARGHPVLMESALIGDILRYNPHGSLRDFIGTRAVTPFRVPDRGILIDIDTMADYEQSIRRASDGFPGGAG